MLPWKRFQLRTSTGTSLRAMRVLLADPPAFTPAYDHELAAALVRAGADVELVTSRFRFGDAPVPGGVRAAGALLSALVAPLRAFASATAAEGPRASARARQAGRDERRRRPPAVARCAGGRRPAAPPPRAARAHRARPAAAPDRAPKAAVDARLRPLRPDRRPLPRAAATRWRRSASRPRSST